MTNQNLNEILTNSVLPEDLKARLFLVLPKCEKNFQDYLARVFTRQDSLIGADDLVADIEIYIRIQDLLKTGATESKKLLIEELEKNKILLNDYDRLLFLNFLLDIRPNFSRYKFSSSELKAIVDFELQNFWYLTKKEIIYLLEHHAFYLNAQVSLLQEIKSAVFLNSWTFDLSFPNSAFNALLSNKEPVGLNGSQVLGGWIKDFVNFNPTSFQSGDIMSIGVYFTKNSLVRALPEDERKNLSEILKLSIWLQDYSIDEDAVMLYMREQGTAKSASLTSVLYKKFEQNPLAQAVENQNNPLQEPEVPEHEELAQQESVIDLAETQPGVQFTQESNMVSDIVKPEIVTKIPPQVISSAVPSPKVPLTQPENFTSLEAQKLKVLNNPVQVTDIEPGQEDDQFQESSQISLPSKVSSGKAKDELVSNKPTKNLTLKPLPKIQGSVNIQELLQKQKQNMTSIKSGVKNQPLSIETRLSSKADPLPSSTPSVSNINIDAKLEDLRIRSKKQV